jgi:alkylresorcinol/alkylpyrone synthase
MLTAIVEPETRLRAREALDVDILSVACATPKHTVAQQEIIDNVNTVFPGFGDRVSVYANAGIETRYFCQPPDWYPQPHRWEERNRLFRQHALDLLEQVAREAVSAAGIGLRDVDVLITHTFTGLSVPTLDAMLLNRLDLPETVERLPIFGLGCGGGVGTLARAASIARGMPGANILCLVVDLATLSFRVNDPRMVNFIAGAIFGDGAAGVVLRNTEGAARESVPSLARVGSFGEHLWRYTESMAGSAVKDDGLAVVLNPALPEMVQRKVGPTVAAFLDRQGLRLQDFDGFLSHPGSSGVLEGLQVALGLDRKDLQHSWDVLRDYGNMSSPTVLFVLDRAIKAGARGRHLLLAIGPGLSAYFAVADL